MVASTAGGSGDNGDNREPASLKYESGEGFRRRRTQAARGGVDREEVLVGVAGERTGGREAERTEGRGLDVLVVGSAVWVGLEGRGM